ncbi:hypothetical protein MMC17_008836 [Xylographa soralifera]|nr:hypothetical protein [Xylographa soralifera]
MALESHHKKCHRYIKSRRWLSLKPNLRAFRLPSELKDLRKVARTQRKLTRIERQNKTEQDLDGSEPMSFTTRIVLRSRGRLPARRLVRLHQYHKKTSVVATHEWAALRAGIQKCSRSLKAGLPATDPPETFEHLENHLRRMVRTVFEEQLKCASQAFQVAHCDLVGLNPRTQHLLESFFETFGLPNEAEIAVLSHLALVGVDVVNSWFTEKTERLVQLMPGYENGWYENKVFHRNYWRYKIPYSRF